LQHIDQSEDSDDFADMEAQLDEVIAPKEQAVEFVNKNVEEEDVL